MIFDIFYISLNQQLRISLLRNRVHHRALPCVLSCVFFLPLPRVFSKPECEFLLSSTLKSGNYCLHSKQKFFSGNRIMYRVFIFHICVLRINENMKKEYITERASALKANSILASYWLFDIWRPGHKY